MRERENGNDKITSISANFACDEKCCCAVLLRRNGGRWARAIAMVYVWREKITAVSFSAERKLHKHANLWRANIQKCEMVIL